MTISSGHSGTKDVIAHWGDQIDRAIDRYCSVELTGPTGLRDAMRYSLESGGKRLRPVLTLLSAQACGGSLEQAMIPAVAVEMVHTFSLIHDDLPAMDDDDLRRGRPTSHKVYGEAMAILAGDALLIFAFELLAKHIQPPQLAARMCAELAEAGGPGGMTGGQAMDMDYQNGKNDPAVMEQIHLLKTAAMIRCSTRLGALAAGTNQTNVELLGQYGTKLGLAFQIVDDLLDVTGTRETVGKHTGKDAGAGKPNYAVLLGVDRAKARADALIAEAIAALDPLGQSAEPLRELAQFVLGREN